MGDLLTLNREEIIASKTFDAMMASMARPGKKITMPSNGITSAIEVILDREVSCFAEGGELANKVVELGARLTDLNQASYVLISSPQQLSAHLLMELKCGTLTCPEEGATLIVQADLERGAFVEVTGPGVKDINKFQVGGLPSDFWGVREQCMSYPLGWDIIFIDKINIVSVPRTSGARGLS